MAEEPEASEEAPVDGEDEERALPIDFFETEFLSNTPDPRQRDRDLILLRDEG